MDLLYSYPMLRREQDMKRVSQDLTHIATTQLVAIAAGILVNVKCKSVYPQILDLSWYLRFPLRIALVLLPMYCSYHLTAKPRREKLNALLSTMHLRLVALGEDKNV